MITVHVCITDIHVHVQYSAYCRVDDIEVYLLISSMTR